MMAVSEAASNVEPVTKTDAEPNTQSNVKTALESVPEPLNSENLRPANRKTLVIKDQPLARPTIQRYPQNNQNVHSEHKWKSENFFDTQACFDNPALCLFSFIIPCYPYALVSSSSKQRNGCIAGSLLCLSLPTAAACGVLVALQYLPYNLKFSGFLAGFFPLQIILQRQFLRRKFNIAGNSFDDMVKGCCCYPCVVMQHGLQVEVDVLNC